MDFIIGNNRFGSKGTVRCRKCQRRKGKVFAQFPCNADGSQCNFENPALPCDYCFARGLECGPKLPTPRKMAELGAAAMVPGATLPMHMAIGQPLASVPLQIQIPTNLQQCGSPTYNLSSGNSDTQMPIPFPSPKIPCYTGTGYRPHSITSGFASLMSPMSLGITHAVETRSVVHTWSQHSTTAKVVPVSLESSPELPSCDKFESQDTQEIKEPCIPSRHPLHTLATSLLPIVRSQVPKVHENESTESPMTDEMSTDERSPVDEEMYSEEQMWALWEDLYLQFDNGDQMAVPVEQASPGPFRLKWNRLLHVPRSMRKKAAAGIWDDDVKIKKEDPDSIRSLKSAPSIL